MEGGIDRLREVIIEDKLGICEELEQRMQFLVDSYRCEWREVVEDPERRRLFRQFVNTDETDAGIDFVDVRGQARPADWPADGVMLSDIKLPNGKKLGEADSKGPSKPRKLHWVRVGRVSDFPRNGGAAVKYGDTQIAVFNLTDRQAWRACQNMCPHKHAFVLSRGITGSAGLTPKVTCPLHKKPFSLETGEWLSDEPYALKVFPVQVAGTACSCSCHPPSSWTCCSPRGRTWCSPGIARQIWVAPLAREPVQASNGQRVVVSQRYRIRPT